jgi:hypothetical protein
MWANVNGTHYHGGKRIDESISLSWGQSYSNNVVTSVTGPKQSCYGEAPWRYCGEPYYESKLDSYNTLVNLKNDPRVNLYLQFTVVWSDPNTYRYEKHSFWSTSGTIVDVFGGSTQPAPIPEPASFLLVLPMIIGAYAFRNRSGVSRPLVRQ